MNSVIRKTFCLRVLTLALIFAISACASGSKKTYCDLVVEDKVETEAKDPKPAPTKKRK